jgi:hypothetical protein
MIARLHACILAFSALATVLAPPPAPPGRLGEAALVAPCLASAGYSWCAATQSCVRQWETPCSDNYANCAACLTAQRDGINIACPARCDVDDTEAACACPPAPPCPLMARGAPGCAAAPPTVDDCGCPVGCPALECGAGAQCDGFAGLACAAPFECVATMGPLVADAPGTCAAPCHTARDAYGNCITAGCTVWHDGCNTCHVAGTGDALACTEMFCYDTAHGQGRCLDASVTDQPAAKGEVCHRFCEDGSEEPVHRPCAAAMRCVAPAAMGFDSCGARASRCVATDGH